MPNKNKSKNTSKPIQSESEKNEDHVKIAPKGSNTESNTRVNPRPLRTGQPPDRFQAGK